MERYTKEHRVIIVKTHYKYGESYAETVRKVRGIFDRRNAPYQSTVQRMIKKFEETGSITDSKLPVRYRTVRSVDNIAAMSESVAESPGTSTRHRSQQLDIPRSTMQRIVTKDLHLHAYKIQLTQEPKPTDYCCEKKFPGRVISLNGDQNWPPRSCDLTPCDFFLWGFVKSRVCANKPQTIPELKAEIRRVIGEIEPQLCGIVIENFGKRARVCQQSHGGHLSDIVFHS
jgi:hypothetical protein